VGASGGRHRHLSGYSNLYEKGQPPGSPSIALLLIHTEGTEPHVKLLDFLERSVERMIQGPIDLIFRQEIQPAEIERHLERAMRDNRRRASGANIMPNAYVVELSHDDFETIKPYRTSLVRRLESWLNERADHHNGTLLDRIQVEIKEGPRGHRRRPHITAIITDVSVNAGHRQSPRRHAVPTQRTETFQVVGAGADGRVSFRLLTGPEVGTSFAIPEGESRLGRSADADIRLNSNDVSRHHLHVERQGASVSITDLGSTNGTSVNGVPTRRATLRNGDEICVGTQTLRFVST
jgi:hypothetical protein